ncbi:Zinc finger protein 598 [Sciurus carolinensis]|uniref:Zinc finger protein 598 n=1 Tax=Sciurus carolinensis TaxID=30640 RepID=A0AA41T6T4_SCICA|nr:Zinc finger protein 598 [Sciurus carolinensis]
MGEGAGALPWRLRALEAVTAAAPKRDGGSCLLCCRDLEATALSSCDHLVCYRCSTKMRVLCEQCYCAMCREELGQVVFGKKFPAFATIPIQQLQCKEKYDIDFANGKDLAWHRMQGDPDDISHRGHQLCKFCNERYLNNDELLKHVRRDHYFCHFCDSDGAQDYYSNYAHLPEHFQEKHFLCEEGHCSTEQISHAFCMEIDLKTHWTACHSCSHAEACPNCWIDLQFSFAPQHSRHREGIVSGLLPTPYS